MCAVCASVISERRRVELAEGIAAWESAGGRVIMVSYTAQHRRNEPLAGVLAGIQQARQRMCRQREYREVMGSVGVMGKNYCLEVTHGVNGWHPHIHELLFLEPGSTITAAHLGFFLLERWLEALAVEGMRGNEHAVRAQDTHAVADYMAKFGASGWGPSHELTKQVVKGTRGEWSRTPQALLEAAAEGDGEAGVLWREYAAAFKGRRQLVWSRGLRAMCGLAVEKSDEELAAEVVEDGVLVAELTRYEWSIVVANDLRAEVLALGAEGRGDEIRFLVGRVCGSVRARVAWENWQPRKLLHSAAEGAA